MKDASQTLRTAYVTALQGNVIYNEVAVDVSAHKQYEAGNPFVFISDVTATEDPEIGKTKYGSEYTVLLDIYATGGTGKDIVDNISNQIMVLLIQKTTFLDLTPDFNMIQSNLDNISYIEEDTENTYVVRKLLRIRHKIYENSGS